MGLRVSPTDMRFNQVCNPIGRRHGSGRSTSPVVRLGGVANRWHVSRVRLYWLALPVCLGLAGCATVDFDYPKTPSTSFADTGETRVARAIAPLAAAHPGESGFYLQADGIDALATRLLLAERAERSIDAQYYLISNDITGLLFIESLLRAADRGIRVRLLLDDIQTAGYDPGMIALDSHPNFEIRVFNPFARGGPRGFNALGDLGRVNRRMHNKTFTVDNQITIIGGRNIAAEYFGARDDVNFSDLDAVSIGPVVREVSRQFDIYWNDEYAVPVPGLTKRTEDPAADLKRLRARLAESRVTVKQTPYAAVLVRAVKFVDALEEDDFTWAPYELVYDLPAKARGEVLEGDESILTPLRKTVLAAEREFCLVSPYFVPRRSGEKSLAGLSERGIDVKVITNSLASTNHAIVHTGYAPSRKPLLESGVRLFEARPDARAQGADEWAGGRFSEGTLHTKGFIVDRKVMFLGSFNWDPRSAYINTEMGVIIHSPEIAGSAADQVDRNLRSKTYEVILGEGGQLQWLDRRDGGKNVLARDPETTWWDRFKVGLMGILPIKGQL